MKPKLIVSFSGGRTSAYMSSILIERYSDDFELIFVFMNTGLEHEETLIFVDKCDKHFKMNLIWLEAVVFQGERRGTGYTLTNFEKASRKGEPFEEVVKKYGIPNKSYPHCNRELKLRPYNKFKKESGLQEALTAIGIRVDEMDRMSSSAEKAKIVYPLVSWFPTTKEEVLGFWKDQPFDLNIPEHLGNCVTCWKKSKRKLLTIAKNHPDYFKFMAMCEDKYRYNGANASEGRVFFRQYQTSSDLIYEASKDFNEFIDNNHKVLYDESLDASNGCSESCDIFSDLEEVV